MYIVGPQCQVSSWNIAWSFFPSRVSGRGYKIGPVCVSVCHHSHSCTVWATDLKFGRNINFDNISDEFEGPGHRSKVKDAILKKTWFSDFFLWCDLCRLHRAILSWHLMSCDVMARRRDVTWRHSVTSWHPLTTSGQEYWKRRHVAGGRVNAHAFSYCTINRLNYACFKTHFQPLKPPCK